MSEISRQLQGALKERYQILRELGRGGMAIVYAARDLKMDREVAIKVLLPDLAAVMGPERFAREIAIAGHLSNPHILPVYDSGNANGTLYYVMPLIRGESLRARIDREKQLPIDEALRLTIEVAQALDYAHKQGVIHRDIKPENILLQDGHAIVADFGIARAASAADGTALTQTGMTLGTASYMSPEQVAAEKDLDGRSDVYSLACVAYEMLAGVPPFTGPNAAAIMARQALEMPPSLQVVRNTIPDEVEDVIFQALAKSRVDRFETAGEFADALQDCLAMTPTVSRRASVPRVTASTAARRKLQKRRRSMKLAAGIGIPAVAAAGIAVFALAGGSGSTTGAPNRSSQFDPRTVAILYFQDQTSDGRLGFLADGLTETLIENLDEVRPLKVISAMGVGQFRGRNVATDSVARAFEAGTIVKGSIDESAGMLTIGVQIINANEPDQVDRKRIAISAGDLVAVQATVADSVASFLRSRIGEDVRVRSLSLGTNNSAALALVMQAEELRKKADAARVEGDSAAAMVSFNRADSLLAEAERLDGKWVTPLALRASVALSQSQAILNPLQKAEVVQRGLAHAERALQKDPQSVDALEMRGRLRYQRWTLQLDDDPRVLQQTLDAAKSDLLTVTQRDRTRALAWSTLSTIYNQVDSFALANLAAKEALDQDAFLVGAEQLYDRLFLTSYDLEQFPKAVQHCNDGRRRFPQSYRFVRCRLWSRTTTVVPPEPDSAWADYRLLVQLVPEGIRELASREGQMLVGATLVRAQKPDSARNLLVAARAGPDIDPSGLLVQVEAFVRTMFGTREDTDEAIRLLGAYATSNPAHRQGLATSSHWWWRSLRTDPRFRQLVGIAANP